MRFIAHLLRLFILCVGLAAGGVAAIVSGFALYCGPQLPKVASAMDLKLQTPLRVFSADGMLLGEFGEARRQPLAYQQLPHSFVQAVLAAEDDKFFTHAGVDATGLLRAASELAKSGSIQSGGSTITMQLARNFFLSSEKSFIRKFNEILLSLMLERTLTKEQIFELYVNKIFLGHRAYGIQAASFVYYGKKLDELTLAQWAMLAGLPKAPSKYNPIVNPERALIRRNWILDRMLKLGYIDQSTHDASVSEKEVASFHGLKTDIESPFIAELARQFAIGRLGNDAYTEGYNVYTTIDSRLQLTAQNAVWQGVTEYDHRHGYRGREFHINPPSNQEVPALWADLISELPKVGDLEPAIVAATKKSTLFAILKTGRIVKLDWNDNVAKRLRPYKSEDSIGQITTSFGQVFQSGDVIRLRSLGEDQWEIDQVPKVQAALVSINSLTGAIVALSGGSDFVYSKFNRATQALRQPGSSFKPFIYLKALEEGYTPATLINDAPIVFQEAGMKEAWRPENAHNDYLGPVTMRRALYESRNMVSIRILQGIGVKTLIKSLPRFGFDTSTMQPNLSLALGSHAFTPLTMAGAYAVLANGGYKVEPYLVDRIEDSKGNVAFRQPVKVVCPASSCGEGAFLDPENLAPQVVDEQSIYLLDDMLKDVIRKGTGRSAQVLGRPDIAGKTGTTNGPTDAWFAGYNPSVATVAWLGFDNNTLLGKREYGGTAALPIWITYMRDALASQPVIERNMPAGLATRRIDPETGQPATADRTDAVFEIFKESSAPPDMNTVPDPAIYEGDIQDLPPALPPTSEGAAGSATDELF